MAATITHKLPGNGAQLPKTRAEQPPTDTQPATPTDVGVNGQTMVDAAAIANSLGPNQRLMITVRDGVVMAEKSGPNAFNQSVAATSGVAGGVGNVAANILNGTAGADPTVAVFTVAQAANAMLSSFSFIPSAVSAPFAANFLQYFRCFAPVLSGSKLLNTWKATKAQAMLENPKLTKPTFRDRLANGKWVNVAVDAAHFALDVGLAALTGVFILNTFGWAIPLPAIVPGWLDFTHALEIGYAGDTVAAIFHGVGAAASLADPNKGENFSERASRYMKTSSGSALFSRVLGGQEPLLEKSNVAPPSNNPPNDAPVDFVPSPAS